MSRSLGQVFTVSVPFIGTLTADNFVDFKVPFDCQLVAVSADGDTNSLHQGRQHHRRRRWPPERPWRTRERSPCHA